MWKEINTLMSVYLEQLDVLRLSGRWQSLTIVRSPSKAVEEARALSWRPRWMFDISLSVVFCLFQMDTRAWVQSVNVNLYFEPEPFTLMMSLSRNSPLRLVEISERIAVWVTDSGQFYSVND